MTSEPNKVVVDERLRGSFSRYAIAGLLGSVCAFLLIPEIPALGGGGMRIAACGLAGSFAVGASFVMGLPLRNRDVGAVWNRLGAGAVIALVTALGVVTWKVEAAEWIFGVKGEKLGRVRGAAEVLAIASWFLAVFLVANFPRRGRIGYDYADTFSPAKRRVLKLGGLAAALAVVTGWIVPAPLIGYWHTPLSDCLCDSKNLIVFEEGKVFRWASAHGLVREPLGTYRRNFWSVTWDTGKERVELRPGWFFMRVRMDKSFAASDVAYWGYREWSRDYIREVLATKPATREQPNAAAQ